jgi:hypothetical protein
VKAAAVVTGHTRGLGATIAEELLMRDVAVHGLARGFNADLADRFGGRLEQTRLDLADAGSLTRWLQTDHMRQFLEGATRALLVNNAGLLKPIGPLETQGITAVADAVTVNVAAPLMLSAAFVQATPDVSDRRILHISSGAGSSAYAGWSVYCATKAALDHHARAVTMDDTPGLRVASVAPGVIDTDMQAEIRDSTIEQFPDRERFRRMKQEGRLRTPRDAGHEVVEFLLGDDFGREAVTDLRGR